MRWHWRSDDDYRREIEAHLEIEADRLIGEGASPEEARTAARRAFGSVLAARERFRESRPLAWAGHLLQDVRYAWRVLARVPGFLVTTVGTLALALSLTTVAFTVVNAYVLRPFAVHDPSSLVEIRWRTATDGARVFGLRDLEAIRERTDLFTDVLAERGRLVGLDDGGSLAASFVSASYFTMLRPRFETGRGLDADDEARAAAEPVAVLSHHVWRRLFDRDPSVVGRTVRLNDRPVTIVGVLAAEFTGLDEYPRDVWLPLSAHLRLAGVDSAGAAADRELLLTARLRDGVSRETAATALTPLMTTLVEPAEPLEAVLGVQSTPVPLTWVVVAMLAPVFAAFGLVLFAACANVSNMMLARASARHREIGVRLSLGASRARLVRQLLTEGLVIAGLACGLALLLAVGVLHVGLSTLWATLPPSVAPLLRVVPLDLDVRVFLFSGAATFVTTLLFALVPALQGTRLTLTHALRGEAAGLRASAWRSLLVAAQVAVSLLLVVVATTLMRNARLAAATDAGFDTARVISVNQRGDAATAIAAASEALRQQPGIPAVAATSQNPLFGELPKAAARAGSGRVVTVTRQHVSPEYFAVLGIELVRGRTFQAAEAAREAPVGIVNASAARALWGGADPVGRTLRMETEGGVEEIAVVGVAEDVVSTFVYVGRDPAHLYRPTAPGGPHARALLFRGDDAASGTGIAALLRRAHADPMTFAVMPLADMQALQLYPLRMASWVGTALGAIALGLSISGLYGVLTYTLRRRLREIGIRMALGASAGAVVRLILTQSARLALLGGAVGAALAYAGLRLLSGLIRLQNVSVLDGTSFLIAAVLVGIGAAVAAVWPARRATRVDPAVTLRADG